MRAVLMIAKGELDVRDVDDPSPKPGEALIRIERCGICGSDLIALAGGQKITSLPRILGHEFVGIIDKIEGGENYPLRSGARVVAEPIVGCRVCRSCRKGNYNVCDRRGILGVEMDGVFAKYVRVPLHNIVPVPEGVPVEEAALAQPMACAVHSVRKTRFQVGDNVAVLGAGPIGALIAMATRAGGASKVAVLEPSQPRRALMEKMGFRVIDPTTSDAVAEALSVLEKGDEAFDIVFDVAGAESTPGQATRMIRPGGQIVLVATYKKEPTLNLGTARKREIEFISTRAHNMDDFRASVALIASRQVDVRPLVTDQVKLEEFPQAFKDLAAGSRMKVLGVP